MFFFKPKVKWTPKEIKGDADIRRRDVPRDKELDDQVAATPAAGTDADTAEGRAARAAAAAGKTTPPFTMPEEATGKRIRDNFPASEQKIIDEYLSDRDQLFKDLDYIDTELDKRLRGMSIPYDPKKFPLLAAAHKCPYCGNSSAADVITYDDVKRNRLGLQKLRSAVSRLSVPDNFASMSAEDVASHQESMFSMLLKEMLDAVWRQILIWVLELFYNLLKPLENVPFAGSIPRALKSWIDKLKRKNQQSSGSGSSSGGNEGMYNQSSLDDQGYSDMSGEEVEEYYRSVGAVGKMASLGGIYRTCIQHYHDFNNQLGNRVNGTQYELYLHLWNANSIVRENVQKSDEISAVSIPDGWEYNPNPDTAGLKYTNPVSDSYLRARADGQGVMPSLIIAGKDGTHSVIKTANEQWVRNTKNALTAWWESPDTMCCILRNLLGVGGMRMDLTSGRPILLIMRSVLAFYRNYLSFDLKDGLSDLFNLIIGLVNMIFTKLIGGLATFLQSQLNRVLGQLDVTKLFKADSNCLPWNDLIMTFGQYLKTFTEEFGSMFLDFITNAKLINFKAGGISKKCEMGLKVDKWISLIDSILKFLRIWEFCVDNNTNPYQYMLTNEARQHFQNLGGSEVPQESMDKILQNLQKSPTILYDNGVSSSGGTGTSTGTSRSGTPTLNNTGKVSGPGKPLDSVVFRFPDAVSGENDDASSMGRSGSHGRVDRPVSIDDNGLKILLTNYIGLSEEDANVVLSDKGDCACDNALSDEELMAIREALSKRSKNA